jgi:hypothetical protein
MSPDQELFWIAFGLCSRERGTARKRYTAEQIIGHLRDVEVMVSQGRKELILLWRTGGSARFWESEKFSLLGSGHR